MTGRYIVKQVIGEQAIGENPFDPREGFHKLRREPKPDKLIENLKI